MQRFRLPLYLLNEQHPAADQPTVPMSWRLKIRSTRLCAAGTLTSDHHHCKYCIKFFQQNFEFRSLFGRSTNLWPTTEQTSSEYSFSINNFYWKSIDFFGLDASGAIPVLVNFLPNFKPDQINSDHRCLNGRSLLSFCKNCFNDRSWMISVWCE